MSDLISQYEFDGNDRSGAIEVLKLSDAIIFVYKDQEDKLVNGYQSELMVVADQLEQRELAFDHLTNLLFNNRQNEVIAFLKQLSNIDPEASLWTSYNLMNFISKLSKNKSVPDYEKVTRRLSDHVAEIIKTKYFSLDNFEDLLITPDGHQRQLLESDLELLLDAPEGSRLALNLWMAGIRTESLNKAIEVRENNLTILNVKLRDYLTQHRSRIRIPEELEILTKDKLVEFDFETAQICNHIVWERAGLAEQRQQYELAYDWSCLKADSIQYASSVNSQIEMLQSRVGQKLLLERMNTANWSAAFDLVVVLIDNQHAKSAVKNHYEDIILRGALDDSKQLDWGSVFGFWLTQPVISDDVPNATEQRQQLKQSLIDLKLTTEARNRRLR